VTDQRIVLVQETVMNFHQIFWGPSI